MLREPDEGGLLGHTEELEAEELLFWQVDLTRDPFQDYRLEQFRRFLRYFAAKNLVSFDFDHELYFLLDLGLLLILEHMSLVSLITLTLQTFDELSHRHLLLALLYYPFIWGKAGHYLFQLL